MSTVEILLATHNGQRFLAAQLDSLLAQDYQDFTVLIADDLSSDGTPAILQDYCARFPGKFHLLGPAPQRLGANRNFARLLDATSADYVLFCDQDDVWLPDKIVRSMAVMREREAQSGEATPILVHTDLTVVDEDLVPLGQSFMRYAGIDPVRNSFTALLLGNIATGCTLLANRALYELARPIPPVSVMFDMWLAQVAAGLGQIVYLDRATVLYRQHSRNAVGAIRAHSLAGLWTRIERVLLNDRTLRVFTGFCAQAEELVRRHGDELDPEKARQARTLAGIWRHPRLGRFWRLIRSGLRKPTIMANLGMFALLLRSPFRG